MKPRTKTDALPPPTASEAAFERLIGSFGKPRVESPATAFLDELYARRDEFLDRDPYASIGDSFGFNTKIVGVTFEGRQDLIAGLQPGQELELVRQPRAFDGEGVVPRRGERGRVAARHPPHAERSLHA